MKERVAEWFRTGVPSAGLWAGPLAWLASLQAKYSLVPWICYNDVQLVHPATLLTALIGITGGYLSWRAWHTARTEPPADPLGGGRPHHFVAILGMLVAALFTLVVLLQGGAAFILGGCER